jgi:NAD(P)H-nitrite reductase large subunit
VDGPRLAVLERALQRIAGSRVALETAFPFPADLAAAMSDDTILCRCEGVTAAEFRRAAAELGAAEVNRAKAFSRCGMGRCQGRVCGPAAAIVLAGALQVSPERIGRLRGQAPVKPIPLAVAT